MRWKTPIEGPSFIQGELDAVSPALLECRPFNSERQCSGELA